MLRTASGRVEDKTLADMLQSGMKLTDTAVREYISGETARVSQSLQQMSAELAAAHESYMRKNQGREALSAEEDFDRFARNLVDRHLADGKFQGRFAEKFLLQAGGAAQYFKEQGRSYADRQRAAWQDSLLKGEIATFQNQISRDCDNDDWIAFNLKTLEDRIEAMRPGMDNRALLDGVQKDAAINIIDSFLASGRMEKARGAFAQYRSILGDREESVKTRVDALADAFQAREEARRKKAEQAAKDEAVKKATDSILADVANYPSLKEQKDAAFVRIDAIEDPAAREQVRTKISQEMAWREIRHDATIAREKRKFQELARQQGWTPRQAADMLDQRADMSDRARDALRRDYDGRAEAQTPANGAALAELRLLLDKGTERGGIDPKDEDAIDAYIERHALTFEQGIKAHQYAKQERASGKLTQTQVNRAYKALFPKKSGTTAPGDLFQLVSEELERAAPGKPATDAEVRRAMSRLYVEGESDGSGWLDDTESYADALRNRRSDAWKINVPNNDGERISALMKDAGVRPTPDRVRAYYRQEMGFAE